MKFKLIFLALVFVCASRAQTIDSAPRLLGTYASTGGLPATCVVGQIAFVTGATAGQQIYGCSVTNTWQLEGGNAGGISGSGTIGNLAKFVTNTTTVGNALAADVVALFTTCSGVQYLGADGACHSPSGGGTVTVVGAGTLTSTLCVTGGGSQTVQTPSANCTVDSSGNIIGTSFATPSGAAAGFVELGQGTVPSVPANVVGFVAPTTMTTSVLLGSPNAVPAANQFMLFPAPSSNISTWAWTTFSSSNLTDASTIPLNWTGFTGGGTAQAQTVAPTKAWAAYAVGDTICWVPVAANTAGAPTLNVSSLGTKSITKLGTTALVANDITTTALACAIYDGTEFQLQNPQTATGTISGLTTNVIPKASSATAITNSSITDNGTTISTAEPIATTSSLSAGASPPACTAGSAGGVCFNEGTDLTNVSGAGALDANSTSHELIYQANGSALKGMLERSQPLTPAFPLTAQTASISTATLCAASAGACNTAGMYHVHWDFIETGTACATPGPGQVTLTVAWTDSNGTSHTVTGTGTGTFLAFASSLANGYATGDINIPSNGSVIQYSTAYTACTTGTGTYQLDVAVTRFR